LNEKIRLFGPPWLHEAAKQIRMAAETLGENYFRIHPKGHGSVVIRKDGIKSNTLITYYRGEVYPPWRWGEKLDAIEQTQKRLGLRPNLPDFYNMSLERPRRDPRGFGLLFVDASRKAGLGSSFSHSCDPTCEVRVVAKDGKLSLAMTTSRDLERGEELTFDYNAVTESLHEYHYAVCLCGHSKCRGSFLHFAAADCYQQVLNRNAPIAIRFSNLVKGCMKKVMSSEDEKKLMSHGFGTAAFGAVSFNHHRENDDIPLDSMDYIPIWLRTFVADTLRYIEYERRALPVALLCNHFSQNKSQLVSRGKTRNAVEKEKLGKAEKKKSSVEKKADSRSKEDITIGKSAKAKQVGKSDQVSAADSKPIPGSKPENIFLFFSRKERDRFIAVLEEQGLSDLKGLELQKALQKVAGSTWKSLSDEMKQDWKDSALADWELKGGREKAKREEERKARVSSHLNAETGEDDSVKKTKGDSLKGKKRKLDDTEQANSAQESSDPRKGKRSKKGKQKEDVQAHQISFQAADAEGWSAMEQRIHQLTQTLSRVGRVLDRHRERFFETRENFSRSTASAVFLRSRIHSPLKVMLDKSVVGWMYNDPQGIVRTLIRMSQCMPWAKSPLPDRISVVLKEFSQLERFPHDGGKPRKGVPSKPKMSSSDARNLLSHALLALRKSILDTVQNMEEDVCDYKKKELELKAEKKREERRQRKEAKMAKASEKKARIEALDPKSGVGINDGAGTVHVPAVSPASNPMHIDAGSNAVVDTCHSQRESGEPLEGRTKEESEGSHKENYVDSEATKSKAERRSKKKKLSKVGVCPWMEQLRNKYKLEAAADLLLIYAHTSTFFTLKPYTSIESSPVEVYARELGNAVPVSVVEKADAESETSSQGIEKPAAPLCVPCAEKPAVQKGNASTSIGSPQRSARGAGVKPRRRKGCGLCSGCMREDDCGKCACCLDKPKFGGKNVRKQKCKLRRCLDRNKQPSRAKADSKVQAPPPVESEQIDSNTKLCEPDDVITSVTVGYSGEYVLSSLLQWFTGGIGLNPGLPDMTGCVMLPSFDGCWKDDAECSALDHASLPDAAIESRYTSKIRPRLIEWFEDVFQRGGPWPEEISNFFKSPVKDSNALAPMGSPILDFLVTGDETNIYLVLQALKGGIIVMPEDASSGAPGRKKAKRSTSERLQSTVDEAVPQNVAVANWVQCENPECMKWRKLPWHVDVDALPEKFFCKDNVWNPNANDCSAVEDTWDSHDAPVQNHTGNSIPVDKFVLGARFDVLRTGKQHFTEGVILNIDSVSNTNRVLFHFPRMPSKWDEWLDMDSSRISPHMSYTKVKVAAKSEETKLAANNEPKKKKSKDATEQYDAAVQSIGNLIPEDKFFVGARFDVMRTGKQQFVRGVIMKIDSTTKRVLFHFPRMTSKWDEWLDMDSTRIAPYKKYTKKPKGAAKRKEMKLISSKKESRTEEAKKAIVPRVAPIRVADSEKEEPKEQPEEGTVSQVAPVQIADSGKEEPEEKAKEATVPRVAPIQIANSEKKEPKEEAKEATVPLVAPMQIADSGKEEPKEKAKEASVLRVAPIQIANSEKKEPKEEAKEATVPLVAPMQIADSKKREPKEEQEPKEATVPHIALVESAASKKNERKKEEPKEATAQCVAQSQRANANTGTSASGCTFVKAAVPHDAPLLNPVTIPEDEFIRGARFDILRTGKKHFTEGVVVNVDFASAAKRLLFHFPRTAAKWDEWVEIGSKRIAPLRTYTKLKVATKGGKAKPTSSKEHKHDRPKEATLPHDAPSLNLIAIPEGKFVLGARFDVLRARKKHYSEGVVVNVDSASTTKRVLFHFPRMAAKWDEWVDMGNNRIAPHRAYTEAKIVATGEAKKPKTGKKHDDLRDESAQRLIALTPVEMALRVCDQSKDYSAPTTAGDSAMLGKDNNEGKSENKTKQPRKNNDFDTNPSSEHAPTALSLSSSVPEQSKADQDDRKMLHQSIKSQYETNAAGKDTNPVSTPGAGLAETLTEDQRKKKSQIARMKHPKKRKAFVSTPIVKEASPVQTEITMIGTRTSTASEGFSSTPIKTPSKQAQVLNNFPQEAKVQTSTSHWLGQGEERVLKVGPDVKAPETKAKIDTFWEEGLKIQPETNESRQKQMAPEQSRRLIANPIRNEGMLVSSFTEKPTNQLNFRGEGTQRGQLQDCKGKMDQSEQDMFNLSSSARDQRASSTPEHDTRNQKEHMIQNFWNEGLKIPTINHETSSKKRETSFPGSGSGKTPSVNQGGHWNQPIPMIKQSNACGKMPLPNQMDKSTTAHRPGTFQQKDEFLLLSGAQRHRQSGATSHNNSTSYGSRVPNPNGQAAQAQQYSMGRRHEDGIVQKAMAFSPPGQYGSLLMQKLSQERPQQLLAGCHQVGATPHATHQKKNPSGRSHMAGNDDSTLTQARPMGSAVQPLFQSQQDSASLQPFQARQSGSADGVANDPSSHEGLSLQLQAHIVLQQQQRQATARAQLYGARQLGAGAGSNSQVGQQPTVPAVGGLSQQNLTMDRRQQPNNLATSSNMFQPPSARGAHPQGISQQRGPDPSQRQQSSVGGAHASASYPWPAVPREGRHFDNI